MSDASNALREAAEAALVQLDRFTDIIEGRGGQARLMVPHGQSSALPRQAAQALRAALAAAPPALDVAEVERHLRDLLPRLPEDDEWSTVAHALVARLAREGSDD